MEDGRWGEVLESARDLIQNELVHQIVTEIDKAAGIGGGAVAVFEAVNSDRFPWFPRGTLYMMVYVRLLDQGYPVEFDYPFFWGLPDMPKGLIEALRRGSPIMFNDEVAGEG